VNLFHKTKQKKKKTKKKGYLNAIGCFGIGMLEIDCSGRYLMDTADRE
jgi:hypothetical protein